MLKKIRLCHAAVLGAVHDSHGQETEETILLAINNYLTNTS